MVSGLLPSIVSVAAEYLYVHMCERGAFQHLRFDKVLQPLPSIGFLLLFI